MSIVILLKAYWKPLLFITVLAIVFSAIGINKCQEDKASAKKEKARIESRIATAKDSLEQLYRIDIQAGLERVKKQYSEEANKAKKDAKYWQALSIKKGKAADFYRAKADSLAAFDTGECKEIIEAFRQANDTLKGDNIFLNNANLALNIEAESYSKQLYICEKQGLQKDSALISKTKLNNSLKSEIELYVCYRDWGLRRPFWAWIAGQRCKR